MDQPISHDDVVTSYVLGAAHLVIALVPAVQLVRIHLRIPDLGWTTQKLFFVLLCVTSLVRTAFFFSAPTLVDANPKLFLQNYRNPIFVILDDIPNVLFFTTYTLLVLFWAEIINRVKRMPPEHSRNRRLAFIVTNVAFYVTQVIIWLLLFLLPTADTPVMHIVDNAFNAFVAVVAALGFLLYGGTLYRMLRQITIESKSRDNKLREVGFVTVVCTICFTVRAALLVYSTVNRGVDYSFYWVAAYYFVSEITPCCLVLFILRKLPVRPDSAKQRLISPNAPGPGFVQNGNKKWPAGIQ